MNSLISVIVPVYNVEKYIQDCVNSLINQSYKNIEIILVDDGSMDKSPFICDSFSKIDDRIKVIHKKNDGVSAARNLGLEYSKGEYVLFVDPDDWLEENMIQILYENLLSTNSDISICDYYLSYKDKEICHNNYNFCCVIDKKSKIDYLFSNLYYCGYLWNKLIKKSLIGDLKFSKDVYVCEDLLFMYQILKRDLKVVYAPAYKLYHYRQRENSAVHFNFSSKDLSKLIPLKFFIDDGLDYDSIIYNYFMLNCQGIYISKKEKNSDYKKVKQMRLEANNYFWRSLKIGNFAKKVKTICWFLFPLTLGKILDKNK